MLPEYEAHQRRHFDDLKAKVTELKKSRKDIDANPA